MKRFALLAASVLLAACNAGKSDTSAPWLTMPDLATHSAKFFPIATGMHGPSAAYPLATLCDSCHTDPATFKTFNCTGCHVMTGNGYHDDPLALGSNHTASNFAALVTSVGLSTACRTCHPDGTGGPPLYHGQLFPIDAASKHAGLACSSCHAAVKSDLVNMKCASCHADPAQSPSFPTTHSVAGVPILSYMTSPPNGTCTPNASLTPASPDCLKCHKQADPRPVSGHPATSTTFGRSEHRAAGCFTCHVEPAVPFTASGVTPAPAGYDVFTFAKPGATQSSAGCTTCHANACGNGN